MTPPLVARALAAAAAAGCPASTSPGDGALIHVLAGRRGVVRAAAIGTGGVVGAAWIVSALAPGVPFVTVEIDRAVAATATALFAEDPDVRVLTGDWQELLPPESPFDFLFVAGDGAAGDDLEAVLRLLAPGATLAIAEVHRDVRMVWRGHPELVCALVGTEAEARTVVATRR
jgi:predicted O-methyltransferase YrrM